MNQKFIARKAQSLIETMVGLGVLTVGLLGLIALLSRSLGLSNYVSENYIATYLAAEGIEITKNILDHNAKVGGITAWNSGFFNGDFEADWLSESLSLQGVPRPLLLDPVSGLYSYQIGGTQTKFFRTIHVELVDINHLKINSIVVWATSQGIVGLSGNAQVNVEDHFFKLQGP